ncbi:hypothetical protein FACS1894125_4830 [Actinomycetota bacterium]|nr:hypothetical protein FACS1894125_4830 [Actinomycetota bacterium]
MRYMDDFVLLDTSKAQMQDYLDKIRAFLKADCDLELNSRIEIKNLNKGINFVGGRFRARPRKTRKNGVKVLVDAGKKGLKRPKRALDDLKRRCAAGLATSDDIKRTYAAYKGYYSGFDDAKVHLKAMYARSYHFKLKGAA